MHEQRTERIEALNYDYAAQAKSWITQCNLCGSDKFTVITHRDRYGFPAQAHACQDCGLVFINPVMLSEGYQDFYNAVYRPLVSAYHGRLIDAQTIQKEQKEYAIERAGFLAPFLNEVQGKSLLDIGGSTGIVSKHFAEQFGIKATILDPAPDELQQAEELGLETVAGLVEDYDPGELTFDMIIVCQTIDHLLDIAGTLKKLHSLLDEKGLFFVDIVDLQAALVRNWSVEEAIKIDHPYYLTEFTMETYLARTGFEVLRKDYAADHLHISYICRKSEAQADHMPSRDVVDDLFKQIRFIQNAPRGSSLE